MSEEIPGAEPFDGCVLGVIAGEATIVRTGQRVDVEVPMVDGETGEWRRLVATGYGHVEGSDFVPGALCTIGRAWCVVGSDVVAERLVTSELALSGGGRWRPVPPEARQVPRLLELPPERFTPPRMLFAVRPVSGQRCVGCLELIPDGVSATVVAAIGEGVYGVVCDDCLRRSDQALAEGLARTSEAWFEWAGEQQRETDRAVMASAEDATAIRLGRQACRTYWLAVCLAAAENQLRRGLLGRPSPAQWTAAREALGRARTRPGWWRCLLGWTGRLKGENR